VRVGEACEHRPRGDHELATGGGEHARASEVTVLFDHGLADFEEGFVLSGSALVVQVEVDDVGAVAEVGGDDTEFCAVEMKAGKVARKGKICIGADDDEVFVKAQARDRKRASDGLVLAKFIAHADGDLVGPDAAAVAEKSPCGIEGVEFGDDGIETRYAVFEKEQILVTEDDVLPAGVTEEEVVAGVGFKLICGGVVEVEELRIYAGLEASALEGFEHFGVLGGACDDAADGVERAISLEENGGVCGDLREDGVGRFLVPGFFHRRSALS